MTTNLVIGITGHRPQKIGGFELPNPIYNFVCKEFEKLLLEYKPSKVLSGFAIGWDQYAANVCLKLKVPYTAVIPFAGQELKWPQQSQKQYNYLRKNASQEIIVSTGGYSIEKMQIRNEYIVDNCDLLIGCWDGSKGGTKNCIDYAKSINREIIILNPLDREAKG